MTVYDRKAKFGIMIAIMAPLTSPALAQEARDIQAKESHEANGAVASIPITTDVALAEQPIMLERIGAVRIAVQGSDNQDPVLFARIGQAGTPPENGASDSPRAK